MSVIYPLCFKAEDSWFPSSCGPGTGVSWVQRAYGKDRVPITGWTDPDGYPLSGTDSVPEYYPGPPLSGMGSDPKEEDSLAVRVGRKVQSLFNLADKGLDTAKVLGYVAIAGVGAGLMVWYVPRRKK